MFLFFVQRTEYLDTNKSEEAANERKKCFYMLCLRKFCCRWNIVSFNEKNLFNPIDFVRNKVVVQCDQKLHRSSFHLGTKCDFQYGCLQLSFNFSLGGVSYVFPLGYSCFKEMCKDNGIPLKVVKKMFNFRYFFEQIMVMFGCLRCVFICHPFWKKWLRVFMTSLIFQMFKRLF